MKKLISLISIVLLPAILFAGATHIPNGLVVGDVNDSPDVTVGNDDLYIKGTLEVDGNSKIQGTQSGVVKQTAASSIVVDTGTVITVSERYHVLNATGTGQVIKPFASAPILSTSTHSNGTLVTLINEEGSIILDDNANQALGSDITLGATDTITLYLNTDVWTRISNSDN